jgi:RHS repeat-associated protein
LSEVVVPNGAPGIEGTHEYTYDALGRRVSKFVDDTTPYTIVFVCSGQQEVAEYAANARASSPLRKYVYASYIDEPIILIDRTALGATGAGTDELFYYHSNSLYSVAALTDSSGAVFERYAYDAYGEPTILAPNGTTVRTSSDIANPFMYTGRRLDEETGLYYYRARYYDSALGRFISRDSLGYVDGLSLYRGYFVPNGVDPSGHVRPPQMYEVDSLDDPQYREPDVVGDIGATLGQLGQHVVDSEMKISWYPPSGWKDQTLCPCTRVGIYQIASTALITRAWPYLQNPEEQQLHYDDLRKGATVNDWRLGAVRKPDVKPDEENNVPMVGTRGGLANVKDDPGSDMDKESWLNPFVSLTQHFESCAVCIDSKSRLHLKVLGCITWGVRVQKKRDGQGNIVWVKNYWIDGYATPKLTSDTGPFDHPGGTFGEESDPVVNQPDLVAPPAAASTPSPAFLRELRPVLGEALR